MPYIQQDDREAVLELGARNSGDLNYVLTQAAIDYVEAYGLCYRTINDVMGAFACAAQEFYRRLAADYEDLKIVANGDVYPRSMTGIPRG